MTHARLSRFSRPSLLVLLAVLAWPAAAVRAEDAPAATASDLDLWSDQAHLEKELELALSTVSELEGRAYKKQPTIRVSTAEEVEKVLVSEIGETLEKMGHAAAVTKRTLHMLSRGLVMKYEPGEDIVHVAAENVKRIIELLGKPQLASKEMLRVTLVHEAVHGMDFQHYTHLDEERRKRTTNEGMQAVGAVIEGHAQFVTARAAKKLGLEQAFANLVDLTVASPPIDDPALKVMTDVMVAEARFAYEGGHKFFESVFAARGKAGVEQVMRQPPETVRLIERPEIYLDPSKEVAGIDPEVVAKPLRTWSDAAGRKTQEHPLKGTQMGAIFNLLPPDETKAMRADFQQGWILVSLRTGQQDMIAGALMEFGSVAGSEAFMKHVRALQEKKDEVMKQGSVKILEAKYEDGVGPGGALPGLASTKRLSAGGTEMVITSHHGRIGRYALELTCLDQTVDRKVQDELVGKVLAALAAELGEKLPAAPAPKAEDATEALAKLARAFRKAQMTKDEEALLLLGAPMVPTTADLKAICRKGTASDAFVAAYKGPKDLTPDGEDAKVIKQVARALFEPRDPARTEIHVHAATTEEIAAPAKGTTAYSEFPGGLRRFAEEVAAPGRTWYVVELLEPGEDDGMTYSCFTRIGDRFVFLLKPWHAMPSDDD